LTLIDPASDSDMRSNWPQPWIAQAAVACLTRFVRVTWGPLHRRKLAGHEEAKTERGVRNAPYTIYLMS
jgi:hypothetical protein